VKVNAKGFTLVELLTVLGILAILAGIGIPQYTKVMERSRVGADLATIATVQSAFNAFLAEVGGIDALASSMKAPNTVSQPSKITGTSLVTQGEIKFSDYWDEKWPDLISATFKDADWYVNKQGKLYVQKGENTLPEQEPINP